MFQVCALITALTTVAPTPSPAATLAISPSADTYFEPYGSFDKNFGTQPQLRMDQWGGRQVFLRFPLEMIPRDRRLLAATIRLFVTDIGFNEGGEFPDLPTAVALYDVVTPWTETGLTYRTSDGTTPWSQGAGIPGGAYGDVGPLPKPDIGVLLRKPFIAVDPQKVTKGSWLELDLTDFIRARKRAGDAEVNLLLKSAGLTRSWTFRSKEAKEATERPQLAVEVAEGVPDFSLGPVFRTDWKPGGAVSVSLNTSGALPRGMAWSFSAKPGASKLADTALQPSNAGASFTPDVPGRYEVRCTLPLDPNDPKRLTTETAEVYALSVPPHPRMYVTPQRLALLRKRMKDGEKLFAAFKAWVDGGNASLPEGKFYDMGLPQGCEDNALMYLLTQDVQYAKTSMAYAQRILQKPMRQHHGDVHAATYAGANWTHAVACHYDWCYDQLTAEQRAAVVEWLKEAAQWCWVRSGRPIAHNDGGGRQCHLTSAAVALLGDDPEAPELFRKAHDNFRHNLLPWLNDGGQGGRSGDGGSYEGLHAFFIVRHAAMCHTATGEDVFSDSPFFRNRVNHILFGWYPRRLYAPDGSYSIRTYYSPAGDHIRMGYVGDVYPYQSVAVLCDRYRDTPEGQGLRWLAGSWTTERMRYAMKWAVLADFDNIPTKQPPELTFLDRGFNTVYMRSDWTDDATWVLLEDGPFVSWHQALWAGGFEIFKGDILAARTGNCDFGNMQAPHAMNYCKRTIATNSLLINDPEETWKGWFAGGAGISDGGGQRVNRPVPVGGDVDNYFAYRDVNQRGAIRRFADNPQLTYALDDLTNAYTNPRFHNGKENKPKVSNVTRQLLYLRDLDTVAVFDRVSSTNPAFRKTFLLHSLGELDLLDGQATKVDDGEFHYTGATQAVIKYGWPKPHPSFGRCLSVTLLPENAQITKIGGRVDLPPGQTEGYPGHKWHGPHTHRHLKDFWVNGVNYPPQQPPEARWFLNPPNQYYVSGTPDESGGRGKWRIEVCPPSPAQDDVFFHVLCPRLGTDGPFPAVKRLKAEGFEGALVTEGQKAAAVLFAGAERQLAGVSVNLPPGKWLLVVADLEPGEYQVKVNAAALPNVTVKQDGLLMLPDVSGAVMAARREP